MKSMKKIFCIIWLVSIATIANANENESQIKTLMEAQGLLEMFENQIKMGKVEGEKMGDQMMEQMMSQMNPNKEFKSRFKLAFDNFMKKLQSPWGAKEIVMVWGDYYGKHFSNEELDQLIVFYTSPIGKKEVSASKLALTEFTNHFQKLSEPLFNSALQEYIKELKIVALECKCKKI